jgi:hypothetical protein
MGNCAGGKGKTSADGKADIPKPNSELKKAVDKVESVPK